MNTETKSKKTLKPLFFRKKSESKESTREEKPRKLQKEKKKIYLN